MIFLKEEMESGWKNSDRACEILKPQQKLFIIYVMRSMRSCPICCMRWMKCACAFRFQNFVEKHWAANTPRGESICWLNHEKHVIFSHGKPHAMVSTFTFITLPLIHQCLHRVDQLANFRWLKTRRGLLLFLFYRYKIFNMSGSYFKS